MKKLALLVALCACLLCAAALPAFAANDETSSLSDITSRYAPLEELNSTTTSSDQAVTDVAVGVLTAVNRALNGATVSFSGEVIGDVINAGDGNVWVNILSSGASIGVLMSAEDAEGITYGASYSTTGTTLQITGVYSIACADHQGELDVHATEVTVLDDGGKITHTVQRNDVVMGLVLCLIGFALLLVFSIARRRYDNADAAEKRRLRKGRK